jgi:hypothetical protein
MKKIKSNQLLDELQSDVRQLIASARMLKMEDPGHILDQPAPGKWSVVQVLEHLNSYGRYYLLAIERSIQKKRPAREFFKPGWLGDYFTRIMKPAEDGSIANKMKSPKDHRPGANLDIFPVLNTFLEQQYYLLNLLDEARSKDIGGIRTPISISRVIRLKLGDTFRFLIAHEQRHFVQIRNGLAALKDSALKNDTMYPAA